MLHDLLVALASARRNFTGINLHPSLILTLTAESMWKCGGLALFGRFRFHKQIKRQSCTYNVTLKRVLATIVVMEKQSVLHNVSVCQLKNKRSTSCHFSLLYRAISNIILNVLLIAQCFIIKIH